MAYCKIQHLSEYNNTNIYTVVNEILHCSRSLAVI